MRILLPPSEAKNPGGRRRPATQAQPDEEPWQQARRPVLDALLALCRRPDAAAALLLPESVAASAIAANLAVPSAPLLPALQRYAGVLYDGLAVAAFSPPQRRLADRAVLVFSGLFGVVTGGERIPAYRVPAKAALPGVGIAGTYWRRQLETLLPTRLDRGLIVDLRSSDYSAMWQPPRGGELEQRLLGVRMLSRKPDGELGVISYNSKHAKGRLAAALLARRSGGGPVATGADVIEAWLEIGGRDGQLVAAGRQVHLIE